MNLAFLAPAFLIGLAAIAVPIYVHLVHRQRKDVVAFPSLMFLERIPYRSVRRQRIRHWALLLLRCLALVLLAAAFARPFVDRTDAGIGAVGEAREVVVLLDRSFSMGRTGAWEAARAEAERVIAGLGPADRATLVVFDEAAHALVQATTDRARLRAALDTVEVGSRATRFGPALQLADRVLGVSDRPHREAVLISDFQKAGWESAESIRLPAGASLTTVPVGGADSANVAVGSVVLDREYDGGTERVAVSARVVNTGPEAVEDLAVTLELNGRELQTRRIAVPANAAAVADFTPVITPEGETRGVVRVAADALPANDTFHFVLSPDQAIPILILEGADPEAGVYLRRALEIGEEPGFRVTAKSARRFRAADLDGRAVVFLNGAPFPGGAAGRALREWVLAGGGLVVVLGEGSRGPGELGDLLPGTFGAPVDRAGGRGGALGRIEFSHPIFEPFAAPGSGNFTGARFYRLRPIIARDSARVIARFDDGAIALVERRVGAGRVLLWASTLDAFWNDLALQPVFLPFAHQLAKYSAGYAPARPFFTVGDAVDLDRRHEAVAERAAGAAAGGAAVDDAVATNAAGAAGSATRVDGAMGADGATGVAGAAAGAASREPAVVLTPRGGRITFEGGAARRVVELGEHGFYQVREGERGEGESFTVAANLELAESDLARLDPAELTAAVTTAGGVAAAGLDGELAPEDHERRQSWWWYLLAAAFALLALETVISNALARRHRV